MTDLAQQPSPGKRHRRKYDLVSFTKMHGLGNDFMVVEELTQKVSLNPSIIRTWSNRHTGIGFDQLLVLSPPLTSEVDFQYRIFNADGSEAGQCGNGSRAIARFILDQKLSLKSENTLATATNTMAVRVLDSGLAQVDMDQPLFEAFEIPFEQHDAYLAKRGGVLSPGFTHYEVELQSGKMDFYTVAVGNPHGVQFLDDLANINEALAAQLQKSRYFPEGVNVGYGQIIDTDTMKLRVFERGAGETQACGSGATAAAIAAIESGRLKGPEVRVQMQGGELTLFWDGTKLQMTGPAVRVFTGRLLVKNS